MEAKEKAKELINNYNFLNYKTDLSIHEKKECALIAIEEIRNLCNRVQNYEEAIYWKYVKNELNKL
jgi:hypothetical protein